MGFYIAINGPARGTDLICSCNDEDRQVNLLNQPN